MITLKNISYSVSGKTIVNNINLNIPDNQITVIIGPNGAGKSTLLKIMSRLTPVQSGEVYYDDTALNAQKSSDMAKIVALLSQQQSIYTRVSVEELLMFGRYPHHLGKPQKSDHAIVERILQQFQIESFRHDFLDCLSGGQRQQVLIAMTFCQDTPYVLLDEPLNNLDLYHTNKLMAIIKQMSNKTMVMVIHDINQALAVADHIVAIKNGAIAHQGAPSKVITSKTIKDIFNVDVEIIKHAGKVLVT